MDDSPLRSLAKTVSWRLTGTGATLAISFLILGDITLAGSIAVVQLLTNTALYFIHERVWNKIKWGQR